MASLCKRLTCHPTEQDVEIISVAYHGISGTLLLTAAIHSILPHQAKCPTEGLVLMRSVFALPCISLGSWKSDSSKLIEGKGLSHFWHFWAGIFSSPFLPWEKCGGHDPQEHLFINYAIMLKYSSVQGEKYVALVQFQTMVFFFLFSMLQLIL